MSATNEMEDPTSAAALAPAKSKTLPILLGLNTLLIAGVLVFVLKRPGAPAAAAATEAPHDSDHPGASAEALPGPTLKLDNFIIQLKAAESDRYVRVAFDLELGNEADKTIVTARMSPIRDSVISFFSDRTLEELRGSTGMEHTKAELLKRLDAVVPDRHIKAIYITDFVVQ